MTGDADPTGGEGCPRCGGSIEAYALGDRRAATCRGCGWVGVETSLPGVEEAPAGESWEEVLDRASGVGAATDRSEAGLPAVLEEDPDDPAVTLDDEVTLDAQAPESDADDGDRIDALEVIEEPDAERLQSAGITTIEALAAADPAALAAETAIAEADVRTYVRRAAIRSVASGSRER